MRTANALPPVRPHSRSAEALYQVLDGVVQGRWKLLSEPVYAVDETWMVRRGGRLVPLGTVDPQPLALMNPRGSVAIGFSNFYRDLAAFCRARGLDENTVPELAPWAEPVAPGDSKRAKGGGAGQKKEAVR